MALTTSQIITLALQTSGTPAWTSQAGQMLNLILEEICATYDLDQAKGFYSFNFNPSLTQNVNPNVVPGSGPYNLPADYLRADPNDVFWTLLGVPYPMIALDIQQFDMTVQQAGLQSYPYWYAVDLSLSPPGLYVWPPPSGAYPVTVRYRKLMPDIVTPENSQSAPWFPWGTYLLRRLQAEMMLMSADDRAAGAFEAADEILKRYLRMANDKAGRANTVKLDRRYFGRNFSTLKSTKTVGW